MIAPTCINLAQMKEKSGFPVVEWKVRKKLQREIESE